MATVTKTFAFATSLTSDGIGTAQPVGNPGAASTAVWSGTNGNPAGSAEFNLPGKSKSNVNNFEWTGTWEDLGVPAGSTVTEVGSTGSSWQSRCTTFTTGAASTDGPATYRDSAGTLLATLTTGRAYSAADAAWVSRTITPAAVGTTEQASNTTIKLRFEATMATGASNTADNRLSLDNWVIVITYTPGSASFTRNITDSLDLSDSLTRGSLAPVRAITESLVLNEAIGRVVSLPRAIGGAAYPNIVLATSGLVSYWRLGETTGTVAADSQDSNPGTYTGGFTLNQAGIPGAVGDAAVLFTAASTGRVDIANAANLDFVDGPLSIEAWINRSSTGVTHTVFGRGVNSFSVRINGTTNKIDFSRQGVGIIASSTNTLSTGQWYHVVCTKNGVTSKIYINGADVTGAVTNRTLTTVAVGAMIASNNLSEYFDGYIDEVAVYNTVLSLATVQNHYNAGSVPGEAIGLVDSVGAVVHSGGLTRPITDSLALANSPVRLVSGSRLLTETLTLNEVIARVASGPRALTESLSLSDALALGGIGHVRPLTESLGLANVLTRSSLSFVRALTEALVLTDALTRGGVIHARSIIDSLALADVIASIRGKTRAITDSLALANVLTRGNLALVRALTEALVLTNALTRGAAVHARTLTESLALADSMTTVRGKTRPITDSLALADVLTRGPTAHPRTLTESLALANVLTRGVAFHPRLITDAIVLSDSLVAFVGGAVPDETLPTFVTIINTISQTVVVVPVVATAQVNNPPQQTVVVTPVTATVAVP